MGKERKKERKSVGGGKEKDVLHRHHLLSSMAINHPE